MNKVWIKKVVAFAFVMSVGMAFADVVTSFGINFCHGNDNTVSPTDTDTVGFSKGTCSSCGFPKGTVYKVKQKGGS